MATLPLSSILANANASASPVDHLRANDSVALRTLCSHALDPRIIYALPSGDPGFDRLEEDGTLAGALYGEVRRRLIYMIAGGPGDALPPRKREQMWQEIVTAVHPEDAALLVAIKDKAWPYENLTPAVVEEAFPGLLPVEALEVAVPFRSTPAVQVEAAPEKKVSRNSKLDAAKKKKAAKKKPAKKKPKKAPVKKAP